jgi:hypothetical protein
MTVGGYFLKYFPKSLPIQGKASFSLSEMSSPPKSQQSEQEAKMKYQGHI